MLLFVATYVHTPTLFRLKKRSALQFPTTLGIFERNVGEPSSNDQCSPGSGGPPSVEGTDDDGDNDSPNAGAIAGGVIAAVVDVTAYAFVERVTRDLHFLFLYQHLLRRQRPWNRQRTWLSTGSVDAEIITFVKFYVFCKVRN
jgi:hypothetical protein